jgi:hypothetical protein
LPQLFQIDYLGEKKILALEHATPASFHSPGTATHLDERYFFNGAQGITPFPKPAMGKWELRDSYVIPMKRRPQFAKGYCYAERVLYVDKENYFGAGELDLYEKTGGVAQVTVGIPVSRIYSDHPLRSRRVVSRAEYGFLVDFKNKHVTISPYLRPCVNADCANDGFLNIKLYASPEGLMMIMK